MIRDKFSASNTHRKYDITGVQQYLQQVPLDQYSTKSASLVFWKIFLIKSYNIKANVTLRQAMKAHWVGRSIGLFFL